MKVLLICLTLMTSTFSYTMAIYTDEYDLKKSREVIDTIRQTYPFNQFDIEFKIVRLNSDDLNCGSNSSIARLITCDSSKQRQHARDNDIDQALIVSKIDRYGGSGGGVPVITAASPARMMLHEYLHTLGLCDEYDYSQSEADYYCPYMEGKSNVAIIRPHSNYSSDQSARSKHMDDIPWREMISSSTPITNINGGYKLGTGVQNGDFPAEVNNTDSPASIARSLGLYKGSTCDKATQSYKYVTWHPGYEKTIMKDLNAGLGRGVEMIVKNILEERGVGYKGSGTIPPPPAKVNDSSLNKNILIQEGSKNESTPSSEVVND